MIEILNQMPGQFFQFSDDGEAKIMLFELGLIDKFSIKPPHGQSTAQFVTYGEHPTHFIFAMLFVGKTKKEDNGYVVFCLPKSEYSSESAMKFVHSKLKGQGVPVGGNLFSGNSSQN
jgi:hypothetical protein